MQSITASAGFPAGVTHLQTVMKPSEALIDPQPKIIILSGESGSGKTTLSSRVVALARERGLSVAGLLSPPRFGDGHKVGVEVEDVATGQRRPLAERLVVTDGPATATWHFHAAGLAWGADVLRRVPSCDLFVIDELGPLELERDEGWTAGLDVLRDGGYRLALVAVRPALVPHLKQRLDNMPLTTLILTEHNRDVLHRARRDDLAAQILALAGGDR